MDKYPRTDQYEVCVEVVSAAPGQQGYTGYIFATFDGVAQVNLQNITPNIDVCEAAASENVAGTGHDLPGESDEGDFDEMSSSLAMSMLF